MEYTEEQKAIYRSVINDLVRVGKALSSDNLSEDNAIELLDKVQYLSYVIHRYNLKKIPAEYYIA